MFTPCPPPSPRQPPLPLPPPLPPPSPTSIPQTAYTDPRTNITYPGGLFLSTKISVPPLGISESQVDVAIASGNGTFAQSVVFQVCRCWGRLHGGEACAGMQ